jgi:hypothetical protein
VVTPSVRFAAAGVCAATIGVSALFYWSWFSRPMGDGSSGQAILASTFLPAAVRTTDPAPVASVPPASRLSEPAPTAVPSTPLANLLVSESADGTVPFAEPRESRSETAERSLDVTRKPTPPPPLAQRPAAIAAPVSRDTTAAPAASAASAAERTNDVPEALATATTDPAELPAIERVLERYRTALSERDVNGVMNVWPGVDVTALRRDFSRSGQQQVVFDRCDIKSIAVSAVAACVGQVRDVTGSADANGAADERRWMFSLKKSSVGWVIERELTR